MKISITYFASALVMVIVLSSFACAPAPTKTEVVTIQTNAVCEQCKARIEKAVKGTNGVISANLNLDNKKLKVKYDPDKTSPDQIRTVIANTGYNADNVKRNPDGFSKLPMCCQK